MPPTEIPFVVCVRFQEAILDNVAEEVSRERGLLTAYKLFLAHIPGLAQFEHFLFSPELVVWG